MSAVRGVGVMGVAFALITGPLAGQATGAQSGGGQRPPANQSGQGGQRGQANQTPQSRAQREQALRVNLARQLKERLQLTDDQMTKLMAVNQRLDGARRELFDRERATRNSR